MRRASGVALLVAFGLCAHAHDARPVFVHVVERAGGEIDMEWRVPDVGIENALPHVTLSGTCVPSVETTRAALRDLFLFRSTYTCGSGLARTVINIEYPIVNPGLFTLVRVELASGAVYSHLLPPGQTQWVVPDTEAPARIASEYTELGVRHIVGGIDHLLFVTCLLFLAGTWRRVLFTITGFTVAHSVTLALSALGLVRLPSAPIEAAIALSIVLVAAELARGPSATFTRRYPIVAAAAFGLLHGLGFASVLREIGLPQTERVLALLCFNLGVEIGQIAFVGTVWAALCIIAFVTRKAAFARESRGAFQIPLERASAYVIGTVAAFWTIGRTVGL